jgi:hypothetical protein
MILKWLTKEGDLRANRYGPPDNGTSIKDAQTEFEQWQESMASPNGSSPSNGDNDIEGSETEQGVTGNGKMRRMRRSK